MRIKIIGIYKITNPKGRIYIGQSKDVQYRWNEYKNLHCKYQIQLYSSLVKYGFEKHKFEIIHQCFPKQLNELEIYYIDLFQTFNSKHGMNLQSGGQNGTLSESSKQKLRVAFSGNKNPFFGKTHTKESLKKISEKAKGRICSIETRNKMSISMKGKKSWRKGLVGIATLKTRKKMRLARLGLKATKASISKRIKTFKDRKTICYQKGVLDMQTGIYYESIKTAAYAKQLCYEALKKKLSGKFKNNTQITLI